MEHRNSQSSPPLPSRRPLNSILSCLASPIQPPGTQGNLLPTAHQYKSLRSPLVIASMIPPSSHPEPSSCSAWHTHLSRILGFRPAEGHWAQGIGYSEQSSNCPSVSLSIMIHVLYQSVFGRLLFHPMDVQSTACDQYWITWWRLGAFSHPLWEQKCLCDRNRFTLLGLTDASIPIMRVRKKIPLCIGYPITATFCIV